MFTVFEMAPEMNGWAAAIIRTWAFQGIDRVPLRGWKAQSNTGRCSAFKSAAPFDRVVLVDVGDDRLDLLRRRSPASAAPAAPSG